MINILHRILIGQKVLTNSSKSQIHINAPCCYSNSLIAQNFAQSPIALYLKNNGWKIAVVVKYVEDVLL